MECGGESAWERLDPDLSGLVGKGEPAGLEQFQKVGGLECSGVRFRRRLRGRAYPGHACSGAWGMMSARMGSPLGCRTLPLVREGFCVGTCRDWAGDVVSRTSCSVGHI